nr:zinc finger, CCHC-type [Tanacetum cinerariifolium]
MVEEDALLFDNFKGCVCSDYPDAIVGGRCSGSNQTQSKNVEFAKELWGSLESKYMVVDASSKKFLVSNFNNYKMVDSKPAMEQFNELLRIIGQYTQHGLKMDESIYVSNVIDKFLPSWKDFKHSLKHGKHDLSLVQLGGGMNKNNKQNKVKKHGFKDNNGSSGSNKKAKLECWNCGKTGHFKRDCRSGNKKNNASAGGSEKGSKDQSLDQTSNHNDTNRSIIEGHLSTLKELLKEPTNRHRMPTNVKIYDGTGDQEDHNPFHWDRKSGRVAYAHMVTDADLILYELTQVSEVIKAFLYSIPKTVDEMLKRVDDYFRWKEAFRNTVLPKGEFQKKEAPVQWAQRNIRPHRAIGNKFGVGQVDSSGKRRKTKGKNGQSGNGPQKGKIINMVRCQAEDQKRKSIMTDKEWMKVPITFPPVLVRDLSEEALVVEAEIKGYLVRMIHVDEGASIEVLYKHCFNILHPAIRARLTKTQTMVSGFSESRLNP